MFKFGWLTTAALAYAAYRVGSRIRQENFGGPDRVRSAPPEEIGVDVSARV